jgi:rhodanese-related sulfurtransferase
MAMRVHYKTEGSDRVATQIVVKPKIKVPPEQLMNVKDLVELIEKGSEKSAYTLVDSRPTPGYLKGHIPTAISIPFPKMKEMLDKLPKQKDRLVIFYCQGYR